MNPRCDRSTVLIKEFSAHRTNRTTTTIEPAPVVRDLQAQTHPCDSYMQRDFSPHWKLIHSLNLLYIFIVHTMVAWEYKPQPLTVNVFGIRGVNIRIFAYTHIHNEHSLEPACFNPFPIHLRRHSYSANDRQPVWWFFARIRAYDAREQRLISTDDTRPFKQQKTAIKLEKQIFNSKIPTINRFVDDKIVCVWVRVDMHVRIAEQKWIHAKNSDDSINDIMFMFCHHRSNTMYKLEYKLSMFFAIHRWNFGFFLHFTSFIYDIPTSIDIYSKVVWLDDFAQKTWCWYSNWLK